MQLYRNCLSGNVVWLLVNCHMHSRRQQWMGRLQIPSFCLGCEKVSVTLRARARQRLYLNLVKRRGCWLADSLLSSTRVIQKWVEFLGEPTPKNSAPFWATRVHLHISSGSALGHADSLQVWHWLVDQLNNRPLGQIRNHCLAEKWRIPSHKPIISNYSPKIL